MKISVSICKMYIQIQVFLHFHRRAVLQSPVLGPVPDHDLPWRHRDVKQGGALSVITAFFFSCYLYTFYCADKIGTFHSLASRILILQKKGSSAENGPTRLVVHTHHVLWGGFFDTWITMAMAKLAGGIQRGNKRTVSLKIAWGVVARRRFLRMQHDT